MPDIQDTSEFKFMPIERKTIVTEITQRLLDYLLSGSIKPGEKLPAERQLSESIGVPRSSLREALKALTVLGLLEVRQGDGTYLKKADSHLLPQIIEWGLLLGEQTTIDLMEARQKIEIIIAGMAAERATPEDILILESVIERMKLARHNINDFIEADIAFHLTLSKMARNSVFKNIISSIQSLLRAWIKSVLESAGDVSFSVDEHIPIFEAIKNNDSKQAAKAMEQHMISASNRLMQARQEAEKVSLE